MINRKEVITLIQIKNDNIFVLESQGLLVNYITGINLYIIIYKYCCWPTVSSDKRQLHLITSVIK